jgi:hypothetical protein
MAELGYRNANMIARSGETLRFQVVVISSIADAALQTRVRGCEPLLPQRIAGRHRSSLQIA